MKFLKKIPVWGWLVISLFLAYGIWNPTPYCIVGMWATENALMPSTKLGISFIVSVALLLLLAETWNSLKLVGSIIYAIGVIFGLYFLWEHGVLTLDNASSAKWWGQIVVALLLTIGSQWSKFRFFAFGRRDTNETGASADSGSDDD